MLIPALLLAQVDKFEELKKREEAFNKKQEQELQNYAKEQQEGLDKLYAEYLAYEKDREELVLNFHGKNLDDDLVKKAQELEEEQSRDQTYVEEERPDQFVEELEETAEKVEKELAAESHVAESKTADDSTDKLEPEKVPAKKEGEKEAEKEVITTPEKVGDEREAETGNVDTPTAISATALAMEIEANRPVFIPIQDGVYRISSHFNPNRMHPTLKKRRPHKGIDLAAPVGTPIYASADGIIEISQFSKSAGNWIMINHKNGYKTNYFHMSELAVESGIAVNRGDIIGYVGSTGYSSGPHLHYEIRKENVPIDPMNYLLEHVQ